MNLKRIQETPLGLRWAIVLAIASVAAFVLMRPMIDEDRQKKLSEQSVETLSEASKLDANDIDTKFALAFKQYQTEDYANALLNMREVVRKAPGNGRYWSGLGRCEASSGNAREAIFAYRKAAELDRSQSSALADSGQVLYEAGLYTDALQEWDRARKIDPRIRVNQELFGDALNRKGRRQEAWDILSASVSELPMQDTIFDKLTDAGIGVKKFDDLEYLLLKRISRVKSYPVAPYQNNMVRSTLARPRTSNTLKEALGWAISATEDSNQKAASYALLAEIQTLYSRRKEALGALEKARKIDPKDQDYIRVKNILFPNHVLAAESPKELALKRLQTISETSPEKLSQERPSLDVLVKSQLYAEASEFCQTILEKEPSNAEIAALHKTCVEERLKAATAEAHEKLKTPAPF